MLIRSLARTSICLWVFLSAWLFARSDFKGFGRPANHSLMHRDRRVTAPRFPVQPSGFAALRSSQAARGQVSLQSELSFANAVNYDSGGFSTTSVAVGDLNGDGKPDLVLAHQCASSGNCNNGLVSVLLGNGDGTFQPAATYNSGGIWSYSVALADVNGDGLLDIVVANFCEDASYSNGGVGVLLGNGDGTFRAAVPYSTNDWGALRVIVADVNGDDIPDIVVGDQSPSTYSSSSGMVAVLLGNGDGTFQSAATYLSGGYNAASLTVTDLNGNHKPDIAVANTSTDSSYQGNGQVGVLLNHGDGTFDSAVTYDSTGYNATSIAVADVNGDGIPDLLVSNACYIYSDCSYGSVVVFLGNGDGSFQPGVDYNSGANDAMDIAIADINQDGNLDLAVANGCYDPGCPPGVAAVLLGNGDGSFQSAATYGSGGYGPMAIAVADLNGDDKPDLVLANFCADSACTADGSVAVLLNTGRLSTSTNLVSSLTPSYAGQSLTLTATVAHAGHAVATGTVTFYDRSTKIADVPLASNSVATFIVSTLTEGTHHVTATYSGDTNFTGSTSAVFSQTIAQAASATVLHPISPATITVGTRITMTANVSSTSGFPPDGEIVDFIDILTGATLGTAPLSKGSASFTSNVIPAGTYSIVAKYNGDANWPGSASAPQPLDVQDFKISANPTAILIQAPDESGSTTLTVTSYGNLDPRTLSNWSCGNLPPQTSCVFDSIDAANHIKLSITTTPLGGLRRGSSLLFYALLLPGFLFTVSMSSGRTRKPRRAGRLVWLVLVGLTATWTACGSSVVRKSGTAASTSKVTVSASSGALDRSTTITITVR